MRTPTRAVGPDAATVADPAPGPLGAVVDVAVAVVLATTAYLVRRRGLPTDGLWFDDAWVAAGASKAGLGDLLQVSTNHPGFTATLMVWTRVVSARTELLAWPTFVAGVLAPPAVYLVLRRWRFSQGVAALAAVALVVSDAHVQYSTRVKSYAVETVITLAIAAVLPRLVRHRWRWRDVPVWVAGAVLAGTLSAFALAAVAVAAIVLVLHAAGDRPQRLTALALQGFVQVVYLRLVQARYDADRLAEDWETVYDGYIEVDGGAWSVVRQIASHTSRFGQALVGGRGALPLIVVAAALAGLLLAARRGPRAVAARYLLLLLALAFVGSLVRVVPFGPSNELALSPGWRASLWLLPALVIGCAEALERLRLQIAHRAPSLHRPATIAFVVAAACALVAGWGQAAPQPLSGSRSGHEYVEAQLGRDGRVILFGAGLFPYAAEPRVPVVVEAATDTLNGWRPAITDPRVWVLTGDNWDRTAAGLDDELDGASTVIVHNGLPGYGDADLPRLEAALEQLGFRREDDRLFGGSVAVSRWERPG